MKSTCSDTTLLGSFTENHDVARFASLTSDASLAKNAIAFTILADGVPISKYIPPMKFLVFFLEDKYLQHWNAKCKTNRGFLSIVYQGQEQHLSGNGVPNNREALWLNSNSYSQTGVYYKREFILPIIPSHPKPIFQFPLKNASTHQIIPPLTSSLTTIVIASVNQIRNQAIYVDPTYLTYKAYPVYSDSHTIVMRKGFTGKQIIAVFSNLGASGSGMCFFFFFLFWCLFRFLFTACLWNYFCILYFSSVMISRVLLKFLLWIFFPSISILFTHHHFTSFLFSSPPKPKPRTPN